MVDTHNINDIFAFLANFKTEVLQFPIKIQVRDLLNAAGAMDQGRSDTAGNDDSISDITEPANNNNNSNNNNNNKTDTSVEEVEKDDNDNNGNLAAKESEKIKKNGIEVTTPFTTERPKTPQVLMVAPMML